MSSFALWFSGVEGYNDCFNADVHFNLWSLHHKNGDLPCLDVGIKIHTPQGYSKVWFYIPWEISKDDLRDLGKSLAETEMLCTVFNEDYTLLQYAQSKVIQVKDNDGTLAFSIYCLDIQNDLKVEHQFGGTVVSFNRPNQLGEPSAAEYYRFRICSDGFDCIIKCYSPSNILLQSAVSTTEAIDFRFNDYRSLSPSLIEAMRAEKSYEIQKVHFLLITEADVDLQFSSTAPTARELEKDVWKRYYPGVEKKNIVAYHWKFKCESAGKLIENCIMFVKLRVYTCNWRTIGLYLAGAATLAILFNYISHLLF